MAIILFALGAAGYWGLLLCFREDLLLWIYGGRYAVHLDLLVLVGLLPVLAGMNAVLGTALRAMERPDQVFWGSIASCLVTISVGLWLTVSYGITGALTGLLASSSTAVVCVGWLYIRDHADRRKKDAAAHQRYSTVQ
jgi:O-antigen/teichoic acid export membrane protein